MVTSPTHRADDRHDVGRADVEEDTPAPDPAQLRGEAVAKALASNHTIDPKRLLVDGVASLTRAW